MKITAEINVLIERVDGSGTTIRENITVTAGDNPAYEAREVATAIGFALDRVANRTNRNAP